MRAGENILVGEIDRIDKIKNKFQIIDYKLSKNILSLKEIKNSLQLNLYTLAFFYPTGIIPLRVRFYFLRYGKLLFTKKDRQGIEKTKYLIDHVKIMREEFQPNKSELCKWCDYKEYCFLEGNKPIKEIKKRK